MLRSTVKLTKAALKARYAAERPSAENASYDLFDPARIYQWGVAIHRVRTAYAHAHNGRKPRLLRPRRFTEKMQWRKLFDLNPISLGALLLLVPPMVGVVGQGQGSED